MVTPVPHSPLEGSAMVSEGVPIYLPSAESRRLINVYSVRAPKHTVANRIFRMVAGIVSLIFGALLLVSVVYPRFHGFVVVGMPDDSMAPNYSYYDEMVFKKVRMNTAADLKVGQVIMVQPNAQPVYHVTRIVKVEGEGDNRLYITKADSLEDKHSQKTSPEMIRGELEYTVPYMGFVFHHTTYTSRSMVLVFISLALLCLAGWEIGTGLINKRDPAAQARAARLQAAAYAGKVAATRNRLARERLAGK